MLESKDIEALSKTLTFKYTVSGGTTMELTKSVIGIQDKFGKNSLLKGIDLEEKATQMERNKMIGGHNG